MKLIKKMKKGFTLVELVVVIAIIAILAGVSVGVYVGITSSAKKAADSEIITQLNTKLRADSILEGRNNTAKDAYDDAREIGFDLSLMTPQYGDHYIWDEEHDLFAVTKGSGTAEEIVFQDATTSLTEHEWKKWIFTAEPKTEEKRSQFFTSEETKPELTVHSGFDAGKGSVAKLTYASTAGWPDGGKEVVIRSNSASTNISIKAPLDTVKHYGMAGNVDLQEISTSSFWEYGKTAFVELTIGRIVLTEDSDVEVINVTKATEHTYNNPIIADAGVLEENMPEIISRDQVEVTDERGKTELVTVQKVNAEGKVEGTPEQVYAYANGATETGSTVQITEGTNKQNETVLSTLGQIVLDSASSAGEKAYNEIQKDNAEKEAVSVLRDEEVADTVVRAVSSSATTYYSFTDFVKGVNDGSIVTKDVTFTLMANVDLKGATIDSIGSVSNPFKGNFDGNGYAVKNFVITGTTGDQGLFAFVEGEAKEVSYSSKWNTTTNTFNYVGLGTEYTASVKNLTVENASVTTTSSKKSTGAAIGSTRYAYISNVNVKNSTITGEKGVGGVIGNIDGSFVESCSSDTNTTVSARVYNAGGIVGCTANDNSGNVTKPSMIYNCTNYATVSLNGTRGYAGGILGNGQNGSSNVIADCTNHGKIIANNTNSLSSPDDTNSGIAGITGSANGVYLILNCINESDASFEVKTTGTDIVEGHEYFNSVAGIGYYGSEKIYFNCVNKANISVSANKVAGIVVGENSRLTGCSNEGTLVNTKIESAVYDLASDMKTINFENQDFASVSELNEQIASLFNSVSGAKNIVLKGVTINGGEGTGTLIVPSGIQTVYSNTKVCDNVEFVDSLTTVNMVGLKQTVASTKAITFGGSGNEITVSADTSSAQIILTGSNNKVINNGTLASVSVKGNGTGLVVENNGTMNHLYMIGTSAEVTLNNHGTISSNDGGYTIWLECSGTLTLNNIGSIKNQKNGIALLFYDGCTVTVNAYSESTVTGSLGAYRGTHTIKIYYQDGATINEEAWTTVANRTYGVYVYEMN